MGKRWTKTDKDLLSDHFDKGVPDDEIAIMLGRTKASIGCMRNKLGIVGSKSNRRISDRSRDRMRKKKKGQESPSWRGGRRTSGGGYIEIHNPNHHRARANGYVFEHIIVAEKKIGRRLLGCECVHHKDGDKKNNSPDNIFVLKRADHSSMHGKEKCKKVKIICLVCGEVFFVKKSHAPKRKTCSKSCAAKITLWKDRYVSQ